MCVSNEGRRFRLDEHLGDVPIEAFVLVCMIFFFLLTAYLFSLVLS